MVVSLLNGCHIIMATTTNNTETEQGKILGDWLKNWKDIIPTISSWLKLLALIVLVASTFIIIAMFITPRNSTYFSIYPITLVVLLVIVIIGLFIDRHDERVYTTRPEVTRTDNNNLKIEQMPVVNKGLSYEQNFSDTRLGFKLYSSQKPNWKKVIFLNYGELLLKVGLIEDEKEGKDLIERSLVSNAYAAMFSNSENIMFQFGENIVVEFLKESSTQAGEEYLARAKKYLKETENKDLTDEMMMQERKRLFLGNMSISKITFQVGLIVQVLEKKLAITSIEKPTLPNILKSCITESIEQLSSFENSLIALTKSKLLHVKVSGATGDFTIFRMYKLIDTKERIFLLQGQWSPESDSAIEVWDELKKMLDSFSVDDYA